MLGESLKTLVSEKGGEPGEDVRLTGLWGGNPLSVTVGKPTEKPILLTPAFMGSLKKKLNCSEAKLLTLTQSFRKEGVKFEPNICEELLKMSHSLDHFYSVEKVEVTKTEKVK